MAERPNIIQPREPLLDDKGGVSRSWWRFFNQLATGAGGTAAPLVVEQSALLNAGTYTFGGTIEVAATPPGTLLGNPGSTGGPAVPVTIGPTLSFEHLILSTAKQAPMTLTGNPESAEAAPGAILIGANLQLNSASRQLNGLPDQSDQFLLYSTVDSRAGDARLSTRVAALETMAGSIQDPRAANTVIQARLTALETTVGSIQDPRMLLASLQQQVDEAMTVAFLGL